MFPSDTLVHLSRLQFAFTALFHFLFVPLTLGLTWLLVIMEAAYLKTKKTVYKDMVQFWGKLLAINFAMGVVTGITLEFEFGQNWAYFSRMIGGSFAPVLAIEGITAFMLESTMFGLFFFSWDKLSRWGHFMVTLLMALGASLSIVNILAANSWMQHPIATTFNYKDMTLGLHSILALYMNQLAQIRIGHVAFAGFITGAVFVMGISAYYLLKGRDIDFAKRSFAVGAGFGIVCALAVAFYGDQNGLQVAKFEPERKWLRLKPSGRPSQHQQLGMPLHFLTRHKKKNHFVLKIPYALSLIATHSLTGTVKGLKEIMADYRIRIKNGMVAYGALTQMRKNTATLADKINYKRYQKDLGFAFLLKRFAPNVTDASAAQITQATRAAIPEVSVAFWTFV